MNGRVIELGKKRPHRHPCQRQQNRAEGPSHHAFEPTHTAFFVRVEFRRRTGSANCRLDRLALSVLWHLPIGRVMGPVARRSKAFLERFPCRLAIVSPTGGGGSLFLTTSGHNRSGNDSKRYFVFLNESSLNPEDYMCLTLGFFGASECMLTDLTVCSPTPLGAWVKTHFGMGSHGRACAS